VISVGLAVPFTLGIVTAINPCGFAMLPTWLGYFLGRDTADRHARPEQVVRAVSVSLTLSATFVILFGTLGLAVNSITSEAAIADKTPWVTVVLGLCLVPYGLALLIGRQVRIPFFKPGRGPRDREFWSVVGFGASYAVVSGSCSAPIFLLHVAGSFGRDGIVDGIAVYLAYAAGMAAVITSLTLSLALARGGLARHLQRLLPHLDRIGGQRVSDGVADPLSQQGADAGRGLDQSGGRGTGLGYAKVQRIVGHLGELPIGLDHERNAGRLDGDLDEVEVNLGEVADLVEGRLDHGLRGHPSAVFLVEVGV